MAKPASSSSPPIAPKKRGGIARAARRRAARRTETRRSNPGLGAALETFKTVGASVGAYGGARLVQRMAWTIVSKRRPTWGKHIHAAAGAALFGAAWWLGGKVKAVARYHEAILVGIGVAAVQGVVSAYIPKYAWLMNDCRPEDLRLPAGAQNPQNTEASGEVSTDYLEEQLAAYEQGHAQKRSRRPVQQAIETAAAADGEMGIDETLLEELGNGESIDDLYGGVFEDPTLAN